MRLFERSSPGASKEEEREALTSQKAELQTRLDRLEEDMSGSAGVPDDAELHEKMSQDLRVLSAQLEELNREN